MTLYVQRVRSVHLTESLSLSNSIATCVLLLFGNFVCSNTKGKGCVVNKVRNRISLPQVYVERCLREQW